MTFTSPVEPTGDLADPGFHAGTAAHDHLRQLRRHDPVAWQPACDGAPGFWNVTKYTDVVQVCRSADVFASGRGNVLNTLLPGGDTAAQQMLAVSDGPRHAAVRKLLWRALTPEALGHTADRVRANTRDLIRRAVAEGSCEFAHNVAAHIPLMAICDLFGIPASDRAFILRHASSALSSDTEEHRAEQAMRSKSEILLYFTRFVADCSRQPPSSRSPLMDVLIDGTVDGQNLRSDEIIYNCYSLILGGDETTRLAMISGVLELVRLPDQWTLLRSGTPIDAAVNEVLRWSTPVMHVGRTAGASVTLGAREVAKGDLVIAWLSSANFDEDEFSEPENFDVTRAPNRHVTLSHGPHFCIGAYLAKIEVAALLQTMREEVREMELTGEPIPIYSNLLSGYSKLPLRIR
ncbi:cytochrome P450 [Streptomyces violaceusniger]